MKIDIREIRNHTGMTQKAFADKFGIPISTLRKWEQHESTPPEYVLRLIVAALPCTDESLKHIHSKDGSCYYYNENDGTVSDSAGNKIKINESLDGVKEQNLPLYLEELFNDFYAICDKFEKDLRFDKEEDIIWS